MLSPLLRGVRSPAFAYSWSSRSALAENHCHWCTTDMHTNSAAIISEKNTRIVKNIHNYGVQGCNIMMLSPL